MLAETRWGCSGTWDNWSNGVKVMMGAKQGNSGLDDFYTGFYEAIHFHEVHLVNM